MKNILEYVLLQSGTGMINGFFRLPRFISPTDWWNWRFYTEQLGMPGNLEDEEIKQFTEEFEVLKKKLGKILPLIESYDEKPIVNLSKEDGTFLGTYEIKEIQDPGSGEEHGQYFLYLKSEHEPEMTICVETEMSTLGSDYGTCQIIIEGAGEELLFQ